MGAIKTLLTFEEFERLEDEWPGKTELLDGELIQLPPPIKSHSDHAHYLLFKLYAALQLLKVDRSLAGEARMETGYMLGRMPGSWIIPDVSVTWPNQTFGKYFEGAPMIAIEIVSESNYPAYIARKRKKYLKCGAAEVWVLYPETRHAMVYTATGERREDSAFHSELLPGVEIPFSDFL